MSDETLVETLQAHYGAAARRAELGQAAAQDGGGSSTAAGGGCSPAVDACCGSGVEAPGSVFGSGLYGTDDLAELPAEAVAGSIGCANPVALAQLAEGEVVLDLGSGGGIDVLLSARRVGPAGRAYGVDMTAEMLELARANQARAGVENLEFLEGRIEAVPLPDASVDVVVSNCVINLSADKAAVFAEAYRVLRPGGRLAVADVVADVEPDEALRADPEAWASCIAGAVTRPQYTAGLTEAGFVDVEITDSHMVQDGFWSVFVRANKP
jgi:SAM-dependent methyltransferase